MEKQNKLNKLTLTLSIIYLIALTWIILFKMQLNFSNLPNIRSINFIPFQASVIVNGKLSIRELIQNMVAFIPFGLYLSMLNDKWTFMKKVIIVAGASLLLEILQYILAVGATDITDLINNTLGGIVGIGIYALFAKFLKQKTNKVLNILTLIGTIGMIALIGLLIIVNL